MVFVWLLLGMFLDSVSIILLTVPLFAPIAAQAGMDPLAFAIIGIVAIEAGLLTPPFGMCVYTVKGAVSDPDVTLAKIFTGAIPYWLILLALVGLIMFIPELASWLPEKLL
jgi:TRAP-type mannitol/chloroaromatic compound transport system permease large subunit